MRSVARRSAAQIQAELVRQQLEAIHDADGRVGRRRVHLGDCGLAVFVTATTSVNVPPTSTPIL